MKNPRTISRRGFLGAAAAAPVIIPSGLLGLQGRPAPGERITLGFVGVGGMGFANLDSFLKKSECQVVAVCDVDKGRGQKSVGGGQGMQPARERVEKHYADQAKNGSYKGCATTTDFRELCARKDIDAVVVSTPDHWHALCSVEALRNGKDVYCEKPITHLFAEGRIVCDTAKKHQRVWQTGSQQRSEWNFHRGAELVLNGLIGKVKHVEVGLPKGHSAPKNWEISEPPANFDYEFWCGPSRKIPYYKDLVVFNWRWNMNYGMGQLMDWIGHHNDIAHWGLGMDESGPLEVEGAGFVYPEDKTIYDAPIDYEVKCTYAGGVTTSISSRNPMGTKWIGTDGWVFVNRGKQDASKKEWFEKGFDPGRIKAYESTDHRRNFLDCVKSRKPCVAAAEIAFRSATPGWLGYVSSALGRKLKWDPKTETVAGDAEADKLLKAMSYRAPWKLEG